MRTIKKVQQLRLTSHYSRSDDAPPAGDDAAGLDWWDEKEPPAGDDGAWRDWYFCPADDDPDEGVPERLLCVACGLGVDWLHNPHWKHNDQPYDGNPLVAHDSRQCVKLVYPAR